MIADRCWRAKARAMTRNVPPQRGHTVTSNSNARLRRCAQVSCVGLAVSGLLVRFVTFEVVVCVVRFLRGLPGTI